MKTWLRRLSRLPQMVSFVLSLALSFLSHFSSLSALLLGFRIGNLATVLSVYRTAASVSVFYALVILTFRSFPFTFTGIETSTITNVSSSISHHRRNVSYIPQSRRNKKHLGSRRSRCSPSDLSLPPWYVQVCWQSRLFRLRLTSASKSTCSGGNSLVCLIRSPRNCENSRNNLLVHRDTILRSRPHHQYSSMVRFFSFLIASVAHTDVLRVLLGIGRCRTNT